MLTCRYNVDANTVLRAACVTVHSKRGNIQVRGGTRARERALGGTRKRHGGQTGGQGSRGKSDPALSPVGTAAAAAAAGSGGRPVEMSVPDV